MNDGAWAGPRSARSMLARTAGPRFIRIESAACLAQSGASNDANLVRVGDELELVDSIEHGRVDLEYELIFVPEARVR